jgi:hypothetical protein
MKIITNADVAAVDKDIDNWQAIVTRELDRFTTVHEAPLATFGLKVGDLRRDATERSGDYGFINMDNSPVSMAAWEWDKAGAAIFAAAHGVGPDAAKAAAEHVAVDWRDKNMAALAAERRPKLRALLDTLDRATEAFVAACAAASYPKLPAGADEQLLRSEAEMLLASAKTSYQGLAALVASERRDLAALALSPWASTWASVHGLADHDLAAVRFAAIDAAKRLGSPSEQAAARIYGDVFKLFGLRQAFVGALMAACSQFGDGRGLGYPVAYKGDLLEWRDGPRDFPPLTKVA